MGRGARILTCTTLLATLLLAAAVAQAQIPDAEQAGRCAVLRIDAGADVLPPSPMESGCRSVAPLSAAEFQTFAAMYDPFFRALVVNLFDAELLTCGYATCATGARRTQLFVLPDGEVGMGIRRTTQDFEVFVTSGLIDFVYGVSSYISYDISKGNKDLYMLREYWHQMMIATGKDCTPDIVRSPITGPAWQRLIDSDEDLFFMQQKLMQSIFLFLFSHEISHIDLGPGCGLGTADAFSVEATCDAAAFDRLSQWKNGQIALPFAYVALFVSMAHYEALYLEPLSKLNRQPFSSATLYEIFPARDWQRRSRALLDAWAGYCANADDAAQQTERYAWLCEDGGLGRLLEPTSGWASAELPGQCNDADGISEATACSDLSKVLSAMDSGFEQLRSGQGRERDSVKRWSSALTIVGFEKCSIKVVQADGQTAFWCYSPDLVDDAALREEFDHVTETLKSCPLVSGWQEEEAMPPAGSRALSLRGSAGDGEAVLSVEEYVRDGEDAPWLRLSVEAP